MTAPAELDRTIQRLERVHRFHARRDRVLAVLTPAAFLALWEIVARADILDARLFSMPSRVAVRAFEMVTTGELAEHVGMTLFRIGTGYVIGAILGVLVGLALGWSRILRAAFSPTLSAFYAVPKIALLPLLLLLFGIGETTKVMVVVLAVFFILEINTESGVRNTDTRLVEAGRAFGARDLKLFRHVILPAAMPSIFTGLRVAAGLAMVVIVAAEFVASNEGLGYLIWHSWTLLRPDRMFVGLMVTAALGALLIGLIMRVEGLALPWRRTEERRRAKGASATASR